MGAEATVTSLVGVFKDYATTAIVDAQTKLDKLAATEIPDAMMTYPGFPSITAITPLTAPQPTPPTVSAAPDIPNIAQVDIPTRPEFDTVTLGTLLSITLPDIPSVEFPSLNTVAPSYSITAPTQWSFSISDILITDDPMIQAAMTRLANNIANGGTGLSPTIEAAIWARDLERSEQQLSDSINKATSTWAKMGWSLPDGFLAHSMMEIHKEYLNRNLDRSREISIKQAELEQSNLFKSLEMSISLASQLIDMLIKYESLSLQVQEFTAKYANEYIDLQIKTYASLLDAYKAVAQVAEIQVRAQLAKVELYKAQIEGQSAVMAINEQTVKIYSEQLRATQVLLDRYKTEIDAMTAILNSEKVKIEVNKIQMDAWAKEAEVNLGIFGGQVDLFKALSQQNIGVADLQGKLAQADLQAHISSIELLLKSVDAHNQLAMQAAQLRMETAKGVAQSAATFCAGAMAASSAHASIGYAESRPMKEGD
jgi:hypothetical protein